MAKRITIITPGFYRQYRYILFTLDTVHHGTLSKKAFNIRDKVTAFERQHEPRVSMVVQTTNSFIARISLYYKVIHYIIPSPEYEIKRNLQRTSLLTV